MKALTLATVLLLIPCKGSHADDPLIVRIVQMSVDESGSGSITVDSRPEAKIARPDAAGAPQSPSPFPGATTTHQLDDGRLQVSYDFATTTSLADLIPAFIESPARESLERLIQVDADEGVLVLDPGDNRRVQLPLLRRIRPPFDLELECVAHAEGILQITSAPGAYLLGTSIHGQNSPEANTPAGTIVIFERVNPKARIKTLAKVLHQSSKRDDYAFRADKNAIQANTMLSVSYLGDLPLALRKIRLTAHFPPSFGMALETKGRYVVVARVIDNSAAAEASIKKGDVLVSVGENNVSDVTTALNLLANCQIGVPVDIKLRRYGQDKTITITPK